MNSQHHAHETASHPGAAPVQQPEYPHQHAEGAEHTAFRPWLYPEITGSLGSVNLILLVMLVVIHAARWRRRRG